MTGREWPLSFIHEQLRSLGLTRKVLEGVALQRWSEENTAYRLRYLSNVLLMDPDYMYFYDETFVTEMRRTRGWAGVGKRQGQPQFHQRLTVISVLGVISVRGLDFFRVFPHTCKATDVRDFLVRVVRDLPPFAVFILDNAPTHTIAIAQDLREILEAKGGALVFLPKYSPDLNPIELFWNTFKASLLRCSEAYRENRMAMIEYQLNLCGTRDMHGYFRHCGYIS
mmetsp:Transcript_33377/g.54156  ORF Transcript_33377/g.54156 Transcript_33377/m.54156 type:complete len:225 (-) Transcript_33377:91-765(-)